MTDTRYPYTYACDFIRSFPSADRTGVKLSRSDASLIRSAIAEAIGMDDEELARKLADRFKQIEDELAQKTAAQILANR